jgi:pilus assembly protein CpaB
LLVEPQDAEKVALAQTEGTILLTLRNPLDTAAAPTAGVKLTSLMGETAPVPVPRPPVVTYTTRPSVAPAPVATQKIYTVEAIRAAKRTEEKVR